MSLNLESNINKTPSNINFEQIKQSKNTEIFQVEIKFEDGVQHNFYFPIKPSDVTPENVNKCVIKSDDSWYATADNAKKTVGAKQFIVRNGNVTPLTNMKITVISSSQFTNIVAYMNQVQQINKANVAAMKETLAKDTYPLKNRARAQHKETPDCITKAINSAVHMIQKIMYSKIKMAIINLIDKKETKEVKQEEIQANEKVDKEVAKAEEIKARKEIDKALPTVNPAALDALPRASPAA